MTIRVLHVLGGLKKGGIETFLINIYQELDRNTIQFDFLITDTDVTSYEYLINTLGGRVYRYISRKESLVKNIKSLNDFFSKNSNYVAAHFHMSSLTDIMPLILAKKNGIKTRILHSHNVKQGGHVIHKYIHLINRLQVRKLSEYNFSLSLSIK